MDWIHLAQDRNQWRGPVNTIMNLRFTFLFWGAVELSPLLLRSQLAYCTSPG
jgi:hypothetical protein